MSDQPHTKESWNAHQTHPEIVEKLDTAFREVIDPELGLNVMELGLIQNVDIQDESAHVSMIMTTPFCPYAPALLEMTRQKAETAIGIPTTISMGMEPWDPSMMEEGVGSDWGFY